MLLKNSARLPWCSIKIARTGMASSNNAGEGNIKGKFCDTDLRTSFETFFFYFSFLFCKAAKYTHFKTKQSSAVPVNLVQASTKEHTSFE